MSRYSPTIRPDPGRPLDFSPIGDALAGFTRQRQDRQVREEETAHRAAREQVSDTRDADDRRYRQGRDSLEDTRYAAESARRDRDDELRAAQGGIVPGGVQASSIAPASIGDALTADDADLTQRPTPPVTRAGTAGGGMRTGADPLSPITLASGRMYDPRRSPTGIATALREEGVAADRARLRDERTEEREGLYNAMRRTYGASRVGAFDPNTDYRTLGDDFRFAATREARAAGSEGGGGPGGTGGRLDPMLGFRLGLVDKLGDNTRAEIAGLEKSRPQAPDYEGMPGFYAKPSSPARQGFSADSARAATGFERAQQTFGGQMQRAQDRLGRYNAIGDALAAEVFAGVSPAMKPDAPPVAAAPTTFDQRNPGRYHAFLQAMTAAQAKRTELLQRNAEYQRQNAEYERAGRHDLVVSLTPAAKIEAAYNEDIAKMVRAFGLPAVGAR